MERMVPEQNIRQDEIKNKYNDQAKHGIRPKDEVKNKYNYNRKHGTRAKHHTIWDNEYVQLSWKAWYQSKTTQRRDNE